MRIGDFGIKDHPEASRRRLRQVNILNSVLIFAYIFFAAFYALADSSALKLLAVAVRTEYSVLFCAALSAPL